MMVGKDLDLTKFISLKLKKKKSTNQLKFIMNYLNVGFYLVIPLLTSLYIGTVLDKHYRTKPLFTLIFIVFGLVIIVYQLKKLVDESKEK